MGDLEVDYTVLEDSESTMSTLRSDFDDIKGRGNDTENIWGHRELRDAMDEFTSNMDHHREALSKEIGDVGEKLSSTLETWRDSDQKLADELADNTKTREAR